MVSPYWLTKFDAVVLVILGSCLAFWIVCELCRCFAAWRRQRRVIASSPWHTIEDVDWEYVRTYVAWLKNKAFERQAEDKYVSPDVCMVLVWRLYLEFKPSQRFSCDYPNEFGIIPLTELDQRIDDEHWTCYQNRMTEYAQNHTTFAANLALAMKSSGFFFTQHGCKHLHRLRLVLIPRIVVVISKEIKKVRSYAMRKHTENAKEKQVTTEPENEVQQDASLSESQNRVLDEMAEPQAGQPEQPVDLKAGPLEPVGRIGPNGPVNVADLKPGREVDPLLGEKADVLQFLAQLTQAIEGAGIINGKYIDGLIKGFNERLAAVEAAVKQNTKQTRALIVQLKDAKSGE